MTAIASHRGGAQLWPENSPTAFRETAKLPVEFVEFDVHRTADGVLVVHHDPTLDRMTDRTGAIMDLAWAEIAAARIDGAGEAPPTFQDVIDIFRPTAIDLRVEIKLNAAAAPYAGLEADVVRVLAENNMLERTVVSAFSLDTLARTREAGTPGRGLIWLINPMTLRHIGGLEVAFELGRRFDIAEIAPRSPDVDAAAADLARAAGVRLGAYAVNEADVIERMLDLEVVAFTTDRPDLALAARTRRA